MKSPQVTYLCLTTAFWILGCVSVVFGISGVDKVAQDGRVAGILLMTMLVGGNLGLLWWGGFFRSRD